MDEEQESLYDSRLKSQEINLLKTALPFLPPTAQRNISMMISYFQMQKTIEFFENPENTMQICSVDNQFDNTIEMLQAVRNQCNESQQSQIDQLLNAFQMVSTYDVFFHS